MPKYDFTASVTVSCFTTVEADTLKEALEKAREQPMMTYCNQCASGSQEEYWTAEELDGDPRDLSGIRVDDQDLPEKEVEKAAKIWQKL